MKHIVKLGEREMDFNLYEAKTAAAYEQGLALLQGDNLEYNSLAEMITARVGAVRQFLDIVFGEGTADSVMSDREDLNEALDLVEAVCRAAAEQGEAMAERAAAYGK